MVHKDFSLLPILYSDFLGPFTDFFNFIFVFWMQLMVNLIKRRISGVRSFCSANWATTTADSQIRFIVYFIMSWINTIPTMLILSPKAMWKIIKNQENIILKTFITLMASILCCIMTSTLAAIVLTISKPSTFATSAPSAWKRCKNQYNKRASLMQSRWPKVCVQFFF